MYNAKMHEGGNLTYILVSILLPIRTDQHERKGTKENFSKFMYIIPKKLTHK